MSEDNKITTEPNILEKSKKKYESVYKAFMDWRHEKAVNSFSENVLLDYFGELSEKYKSSSLWTTYSMLRSKLNVHHNENIENYLKLRSFLKRKSEGYCAKKAKKFTLEEMNKFIKQAPDCVYLATKVSLIMGIMGACRINELYAMNIEDVQDINLGLMVTIPNNNKSKIARTFIISGSYSEKCKKYISLRPSNIKIPGLFLNYQNGKCTNQRIGINKFNSMGKQMAKFLNLPNPELYSGHSFRKSSSSLLNDAEGDINSSQQHDEWKSITVKEERIDDPTKYRMLKPIDDKEPSTSTTFIINAQTNSGISIKNGQPPTIQFINCSNISNITINFK